jgi:D-alanyl-D-alanine carboxypeptidase
MMVDCSPSLVAGCSSSKGGTSHHGSNAPSAAWQPCSGHHNRGSGPRRSRVFGGHHDGCDWEFACSFRRDSNSNSHPAPHRAADTNSAAHRDADHAERERATRQRTRRRTGQELYGLGANDKLAMASTTKIMTALVTLLSATPLDQPVTVGNEIAGLDVNSASLMYVSQGQSYTVRELLYGLLLPSGDDAALVLAKAIGGSQAAFVARMNTMASFLGLTETSFINPNGLDDNTLAGADVTSAHDLAILAAFAMQNATFRQIVATPTYTVPATATHEANPMDTTNEFLSNKHTKAGYDFTSQGTALGIDGIKTGFTGLAGRCLVVEARFRGHMVILVELKESGVPDTDVTYEQRFIDATNLLKWLETQYQ